MTKAGGGAGAAPSRGMSVLRPRMSTKRSQLAPLAVSAKSITLERLGVGVGVVGGG